MSDKIKLIKEVDGGMVSVPAVTLQSLVDNCELAVAGTGKMEEVVGHQCRELQRHLDAAYPVIDEEEMSFEEFANVHFVSFRKPV